MNKSLLIVSALTLLISGCGGGGSESGGDNIREVSYSVNPVNGPMCVGEDHKFASTRTVVCRWTCAANKLTSASNKGVIGRWDIVFRNNYGKGWKLASEEVLTPCEVVYPPVILE